MSVMPNPSVDPLPNTSAIRAMEELPQSIVPLRTLRLRGLLFTLGLSIGGVAVLWGSIQSVFLALQVQRIDAQGDVGSLSLIIGTGAIGAMVGAPIAGALSDRTRTRIGGRAPWILVGAAATLVVAISMGFATSIPQLIVYWFLLQLSTNFIYTPISAHIPDRVPVLRRGMFSAVFGTFTSVGLLAGQSFGALFADQLQLGYLIVGVGVMVVAIAFVLVNRRGNLDEPRTPLDLRALLGTFWVNPVTHSNFAWAFVGRFLLMVGCFSLTAYVLYILQSYIGLGRDAVHLVPAFGLAGLVGTFAGTPIAGLLADKIGRARPLVLASSLVLVAAMSIPMVSPTVPGILAYSFLAGFGMGAYLSVDLVLITQVLPAACDAGKDLGILNIATTLPQTIGVAVGGVIVTAFGGSYFALFPVAIALVGIGTLCLFAIRGVR